VSIRDEYNCFGFCAVLSGVLNLLFLLSRCGSHGKVGLVSVVGILSRQTGG
jgi:hypothetical protein